MTQERPVTTEDRQELIADALWWIDTHTQTVQQCAAHMSGPDATPEDRLWLYTHLEEHMRALSREQETYEALRAGLEVSQPDPAPEPSAWIDWSNRVEEDEDAPTEDGA